MSCCFGRNFEVHTRFVFDPQQITQIPYKSHIALPYKHSKLAEIAKLRPGTSEKEDTIGRLRASRYEQGLLSLILCHFSGWMWHSPRSPKSWRTELSLLVTQKGYRRSWIDGSSRTSRFQRHFYFQRLGILACLHRSDDINKENWLVQGWFLINNCGLP